MKCIRIDIEKAGKPQRQVALTSSRTLVSRLREIVTSTEHNITQVIRQFDSKNTRKLNLDGWFNLIRTGASIHKASLTDDEIVELFAAIDVNDDGAISAEELTAFVNKPAPTFDGNVQRAVARIRRQFQAASYVYGGQDISGHFKLWRQSHWFA